MKKITADDPASASVDITQENIDKLKALFPELLTENDDGVAVNVDVLKSLVGDKTVTDADEKYGLNWHGKRMARQLALTPSTGTLRPCLEESVDWDSTQNVFIEGDNLEVLKLLQKSYANKVKMIYIDPPYNTGKDFVYKDNFKDNIHNYKKLTGQLDEDGNKLTSGSNKETSGRFHTDWLNMIYPRLKLARNLLKKEGVIFISIDDSEVKNLKAVCDEVFGEEHFLGAILWKKKTNGNNMGYIPPVHDYILCYAKHSSDESLLGFPVSQEYLDSKYSNNDNDPKGAWTTMDLSANHEGPYFEIENEVTGEKFNPPTGRYWVFNEEEVKRRIKDGRIIFGRHGTARPVQKKYLSERASDRVKPESWWDSHGMNSDGTTELGDLLKPKIFDHSKPSLLLKHIVDISTKESDIVLDFFSGSGSMAHGIFTINAENIEKRKFILVQLPEKTLKDSISAKAGYNNIAEIGKERIRRAGKKIKEDNAGNEGIDDLDIGFRVFKLDSSNINEWRPKREDIAESLDDHAEHIKDDRSEDDLLYELLLKLGLDLCIPIEQKEFADLTVHNIGAGTLFVCLATEVKAEAVEALAEGIASWAKEYEVDAPECVFRDSGFADNKSKSNLTAILNQNGIKNIRSI